jgi:hypothetical protein
LTASTRLAFCLKIRAGSYPEKFEKASSNLFKKRLISIIVYPMAAAAVK